MKKLILALAMVLVLCFTIAVPVSAAAPSATAITTATTAPGSASINWYLNGKLENKNVMTREIKAVFGEVKVGNEYSFLWISDSKAEKDVKFSDKKWFVTLNTDIDWLKYCLIEIGSLSKDTYNPFVKFQSENAKWEDNCIKAVGNAEKPFAIYEGEYLYLKVTNKDEKAHPIYCDKGNSFLSTPYDDPGFPLPEMTTIVLLGAGLIGLGAVVFLRRKSSNFAV